MEKSEKLLQLQSEVCDVGGLFHLLLCRDCDVVQAESADFDPGWVCEAAWGVEGDHRGVRGFGVGVCGVCCEDQ